MAASPEYSRHGGNASCMEVAVALRLRKRFRCRLVSNDPRLDCGIKPWCDWMMPGCDPGRSSLDGVRHCACCRGEEMPTSGGTTVFAMKVRRSSGIYGRLKPNGPDPSGGLHL